MKQVYTLQLEVTADQYTHIEMALYHRLHEMFETLQEEVPKKEFDDLSTALYILQKAWNEV